MVHFGELPTPDNRARGRRITILGPLVGATIALVLAVSPPIRGSEAPESVGDDLAPRSWLDASGVPVPFASDDELLEFLRTAEIVERDETKEGINRPVKLLLEKEGQQLHAIFREVDIEQRRRRVAGRYHTRFVDHYGGDCAAYDLARALGITNVPPTTLRRIGPTEGSIQAWLENAQDETSPDFHPGSPIGWVRQLWDMELFDNLILNVDRNTTNMLAGPEGDLWLIDHGRAFQPDGELLSQEPLTRVSRRIWKRLMALSDEELKDVVREHLDVEQLNALVRRRELLVQRVNALVAERGEDQVFY